MAETADEVRRLIREAIGYHIEMLREENEPIPQPTSRVGYVTVAQAA